MTTSKNSTSEGEPSASKNTHNNGFSKRFWRSLKDFVSGHGAFGRGFGGAFVGVVAALGWATMFAETYVSHLATHSDAVSDYNIKQATLFLSLMDRASCKNDDETHRKQRIIHDFALKATPDYLFLVTTYTLECAESEAELNSALKSIDKYNDAELRSVFKEKLSGARARYAVGLRDIDSIMLFDQAYRLLPEDVSIYFNRSAFERAVEQFRGRNYDSALGFYMEAFKNIQ